jgi:hypothetical protein
VSELRPLLESGDDDFERALLQSVHADLPGPAGLHDTALALGLAASTANALAAALPAAGTLGTAVSLHGASVVAPTASAASGGALASGASSTVGVVGLASLGKSLLGGVLVSFVALTAIDRVRAPSPPKPSPVVHAVNTAAPTPHRSEAARLPIAGPQSADAVAPTAPPEPEAVAAPASTTGARRAIRPVVGAAPVAEAPASLTAPPQAAFAAEPSQPASARAAANLSLATEIRALDQARTALAAGDTNRASDLLDAYAASRPSSILSQEAALLRIRVLLNRGQRPAAAELARRIIAQHPESAHVDSLRRLAAEP